MHLRLWTAPTLLSASGRQLTRRMRGPELLRPSTKTPPWTTEVLLLRSFQLPGKQEAEAVSFLLSSCSRCSLGSFGSLWLLARKFVCIPQSPIEAPHALCEISCSGSGQDLPKRIHDVSASQVAVAGFPRVSLCGLSRSRYLFMRRCNTGLTASLSGRRRNQRWYQQQEARQSAHAFLHRPYT